MKVLILANYDVQLYKFRKELIQELIDNGNSVYISLPYGEFIDELKEIGCIFLETNFNSRGINPISDLGLFFVYLKIIKMIEPDIVMTYTIKPNVYGGLASRLKGVKYISNITGLGTTIHNDGLLRNLTVALYRIGLKKSDCIFFQNSNNRDLFMQLNIRGKRQRLVMGSGINLNDYVVKEFPQSNKVIKFLTISRIMKDKGIYEILEAARILRKKYNNLEFDIVGDYSDDRFKDIIHDYQKQGYINHLGFTNRISDILGNYHCIVHPSYHEGLSNALLEAQATGRPVIASNVPGCIETFIDGKSGIAIEPKSTQSLIQAIEQFISLNTEEMSLMGKNGRKHVEQKFDRCVVVSEYMEEINRIMEYESV